MAKSAADTGPLPPKPTQSPSVIARGRKRWPFIGGILVGLLGAPLLVLLLLLLFGGTNEARQPSPAPANQPDLSILLSKSYLERSLANNTQFSNPVIVLGRHPQGGAALTLTIGIDVPIIGVQDIQTRSQVIAKNNQVVVITEQAGLGENGQLQVPGSLLERAISELITNEIEKRIHSNPSIVIDIVRVDATSDALRVDAALRQPGQ
jgi:hypothetical protein